MTKSQATSTRRGRLGSIDVLRGAAALGVVLCHTTKGSLFLDSFRIAPWVTVLALPAAFGFSGVYLFFVISGFCIHLAWARERANQRQARHRVCSILEEAHPPPLSPVPRGVGALPIGHVGRGNGRLRARGPRCGISACTSSCSTTSTLLPPGRSTASSGRWPSRSSSISRTSCCWLIRCRFGWATTLTICASARGFWFALAFVAHRAFAVQIPVTEAAASHWFTWALGAWSVEAWYGLVPRPRWTVNLVVCGSLITAAMMLSAATWALPRDGLVAEIAWFLADPLWGLGFFVLVSRLSLAEAGSTRKCWTLSFPAMASAQGRRSFLLLTLSDSRTGSDSCRPCSGARVFLEQDGIGDLAGVRPGPGVCGPGLGFLPALRTAVRDEGCAAMSRLQL